MDDLHLAQVAYAAWCESRHGGRLASPQWGELSSIDQAAVISACRAVRRAVMEEVVRSVCRHVTG